MTGVVVVVDRPEEVGRLLGVGEVYAWVLGTHVEVWARPGAVPAPDPVGWHVLDTAAPEEVADVAARRSADLVVVAASGLHPQGCAGELLRGSRAPLLVVPERAADVVREPPRRVLVPLDGTTEAATAVEETVDLLAGVGADVVVVHVFQEDTAPVFWDQPVHALPSWGEEFLARHARDRGNRVVLRSGSPGSEVLEVARSEQADLVVLGCAGDLSPGRARLVRHVLEDSDVPVLLVHTPRAGDHRERSAS